jgi:hypothetical protein
MTNLIAWRVFVPTLVVLAGLAFVASWLLEVPLLPAFVLVIAAVLVNGLVATIEDDLPGGFNNPDGSQAPSSATRTARIAKWALATLLCAFAVAFAIAGLGTEAQVPPPFVIGFSLSCILFAVALIARWRWAFWAALLSALGGIGLSGLSR